MQVHLSGGTSLSWDELKFCLEAALRHGWRPEGPHRLEYFSETEAWGHLSRGQTLNDSDARGLVTALDRAISILAEVAERARQGGFGISTKDDATQAWLAVCKEAALKIDPNTAEVLWRYGNVCDPYGLLPSLEMDDVVGRNYFARAPDSDVWVSFDDLPDEVCQALHSRPRDRRVPIDDDLPF
jgi:hypothetical protein